MSEEKPTFKITDRRLFNPDGSPREGAREDEPTPAPASAPERAAAPSPPAPEVSSVAPDAGPRAQASEGEPAVASSATSTGGARAAASSASAAESGPARDARTQEAPGMEDDPQEFLMVVEFIASFAADALGMVNHPGAGGREVNLPLAKQCIDMLGTLQKKTRGNLSAEEQQFFELVISQLRMQYVSLTGGKRGGGIVGAPRGFTGGDITGGR